MKRSALSLLCVLASCGAHGQVTRPALPGEGAMRLIRLREYAAAFRRGAVIDVSAQVQSVRTRSHCAPLHWHRALVRGTSGNAFDETSEMLWIGRDAALVDEIARLASASYTVDGERSDDSAWQRLESGDLAVITLVTTLSGMPGYATMHGVSPAEPETIEECSIVEIDSCAGSVGYVCSGFLIERALDGYPVPPDGRYVFELDVDPRRTYGLFGDDACEVE